MDNEKSTLDILMEIDVPKPRTKRFRVKRLSQLAGKDVMITLKEQGYSRVAEIRKAHADNPEMELHILLAGITDPDLKNKELMNKYNAPTPAELATSLFSAGEIADISREVERLSGYRTATLEEVEKKS